MQITTRTEAQRVCLVGILTWVHIHALPAFLINELLVHAILSTKKMYQSRGGPEQQGARYRSHGASHACQQRVSRSLALQHCERHSGSPSTFGSEMREMNRVRIYDCAAARWERRVKTDMTESGAVRPYPLLHMVSPPVVGALISLRDVVPGG
jgi:hypothetical protein